MNRSTPVAAALTLAALSIAAIWVLSRQQTDDLVTQGELPLAGSGQELLVAKDSVDLPIPEAGFAPAQANATARLEALNRRTPVKLPPPDYAAIYAQWPREKLYERSSQLEEVVNGAVSARFDHLQAHFEQIYANHQYGARVRELGKAFEDVEVEIGRKRDYSARTVELPDGSCVMHVLEFSRAEEPATAQLVAELEWLRAKLRQ